MIGPDNMVNLWIKLCLKLLTMYFSMTTTTKLLLKSIWVGVSVFCDLLNIDT